MRPVMSHPITFAIVLTLFVVVSAAHGGSKSKDIPAWNESTVFLQGGPLPGEIEPAKLLTLARKKEVAGLERAARWKDSLDGKLRCLEKDISLNRFLLKKMQRLYSPRISPTYYSEYGSLCSKLRCALIKRKKLRYLIGVARQKLEDEARFCKAVSLN